MSLETAQSTGTHIDVSKKTLVFIVITCAMIMLLEGFDIQALGVAAPTLFPILGFDDVQKGWVFSSGQAGVVLGAILGGILSDNMGRRNVLLVFVPIFGIFTLATVVAHSFTSLMIVRLIAGIGLGATMTNMVGIGIDVSTEKNRVKIITMIMAGMPIGGTLVSLLAKMFIKDHGWQFLFYIGGFIPLALMIPIFLLPNVKTHHEHEKIDWVKALFGEGRFLPTILLWIVFFFTSSVLYMLLNWLPTLMKTRGFDLGIATLSSVIFNFSAAIGSVTMGYLIDKHGYRLLLPFAYVGMAIGIFMLATSQNSQYALIAIGIVGVFLLGAQYSLSGVSPMYYPKAVRGFGTGASVAFGRIGSITGPLAAGYILKTTGDPSSVAMAMLPVLLLAGISAIFLTQKAKILEK